tara:strand:+ start:354 stop:848 length:495 start_codon:yes stop_codon:yes gene_type:complete
MTSRLLVDKIEGKSTTTSLDLSAVTNLQMPSGSVVQVVNTLSTLQRSTTSSSDTDTGITLDITPKFATSKLYFLFSARTYVDQGGREYFIKIKDGSNLVGGGATLFDGGDRMAEACTFQAFHTPNTTSTKTYKITHAVSGGTGYINVQSATDFPMHFTIMEITQ